jgi:hypothetical protein
MVLGCNRFICLSKIAIVPQRKAKIIPATHKLKRNQVEALLVT